MLQERRSLVGTHQRSWWFTDSNYYEGTRKAEIQKNVFFLLSGTPYFLVISDG